ncbi:MAG TPA: TlpA disulfide reductase family protein [Pseudolabrys sp.]|nr:TlpA disulfide reductase family protein [Pseudolabrys sp.]
MFAPAGAAELAPWTDPTPPAFDLPLSGAPPGATFSLSRQSGEAILIHFFASWCEPCREELPALKRLAHRGAPDLQVVAVAVADNDSRLRRLLDETGVTFPVLKDDNRAVARAWSISALPSTVILDARHRARLSVESDFAWDTIEPKQLIDRLSLPAKDVSQQSSVSQGGH